MLEASKAENKDAMVVTKATAEKHQLKSIEDMATVCGDLVIGAPATFAEREYGLPGLEKNYNCVPKNLEPFSDGGGAVHAQGPAHGQGPGGRHLHHHPFHRGQRLRGA